MDEDIPFSRHDDGIFQFQKKLVHEPVSVVEFAKRVISDFQIAEKERFSKIKFRGRNEFFTRRQLLQFRRARLGKIESAEDDLHSHSTKQEHENADLLESFFLNVEPDYTESNEWAAPRRVQYFWRVALLNAFRILQLMDESSVKFPHGWVRINCTRNSPNFCGLVSSAAFQMGFYHAKAQAMKKATAVIHAKKMENGRQGKLGPTAMAIREACAVIVDRGEKLVGEKASRRVMLVLEEMGRASLNPKYVIDGKDVGTSEINRQIKNYNEGR